MARGRGGYQQPKNPAPVSNPGSGARTDGGAGQPIRLASQQAYGERQKMESAQAAAPMATAASPAVPVSPTPSGAPRRPLPQIGGPEQIFGPTRRPNESILAGAETAGMAAAFDADDLLRMIYARYPSPYIARLMRNG